jgi:predicted transcriptional regulator
MLVCTREEANKLLQDEVNLLKDDKRNHDVIDYQVETIERGRGEGNGNKTMEERKEIAAAAIASGLTNDEIAKAFDVSHQAVSSYKHGATSEATYHKKVPELESHVNQVKNQISEAAQNKLMTAINLLTDSKIGQAKARDIAGIAKEMSVVLKNMTPEGPLIDNRKVLVYQPRLKEEDDFVVINLNE